MPAHGVAPVDVARKDGRPAVGSERERGQGRRHFRALSFEREIALGDLIDFEVRAGLERIVDGKAREFKVDVRERQNILREAGAPYGQRERETRLGGRRFARHVQFDGRGNRRVDLGVKPHRLEKPARKTGLDGRRLRRFGRSEVGPGIERQIARPGPRKRHVARETPFSLGARGFALYVETRDRENVFLPGGRCVQTFEAASEAFDIRNRQLLKRNVDRQTHFGKGRQKRFREKRREAFAQGLGGRFGRVGLRFFGNPRRCGIDPPGLGRNPRRFERPVLRFLRRSDGHRGCGRFRRRRRFGSLGGRIFLPGLCDFGRRYAHARNRRVRNRHAALEPPSRYMKVVERDERSVRVE